MNRNEFLILRYLLSHKSSKVRDISNSLELSLGLVSVTKNNLFSNGLINVNGEITKKGKSELNKYRVDNAIVLAAGLSTRCAPLSFDTPKGLLKVGGEVLIERQIEQLLDAGIKNITLVLGYKKESFFYLGEKYNIDIIINPKYDSKNSSYSAYLARHLFKNTYICSSDSYFVNNPFYEYEYESYAVSEKVDEVVDGSFLKTGAKKKVVSRTKEQGTGYLFKGIMFWNKTFSFAVKEMLDNRYSEFEFDSIYTVIFNNLKSLPPIYCLTKKPGEVFRFYNLKELIKFDEKYIEHTSSSIMKNISSTLNCLELDIKDFLPIKEGLTNTSYTFVVNGNKYVYRHPGDGTEKIINRKNEMNSLIIAKEIGMDPSFIKMDYKSGWKISHYIPNTREPDYYNFDDSKLIIRKMKELHDKKLFVDWKFSPWEDALEMEETIRKKTNIDMPDFDDLKSNVHKLYLEVEKDGLVEKCFCHADTYKPNWLIDKDTNNVTLIDWEYAGYSDPGVDVGYYIVDAMYEIDDALKFIKEYLKENYSLKLEKHYFYYISIIAYYWFVWALYRESCSAIMGESLYNWYYMAKKYSKYALERYK